MITFKYHLSSSLLITFDTMISKRPGSKWIWNWWIVDRPKSGCVSHLRTIVGVMVWEPICKDHLPIFSLTEHAPMHLCQKAEILAEAEGDALQNPFSNFLARLCQPGQSEPATDVVLNDGKGKCFGWILGGGQLRVISPNWPAQGCRHKSRPRMFVQEYNENKSPCFTTTCRLYHIRVYCTTLLLVNVMNA